ncbi:MAG: hypothetical protein IJY23_02200 [Clostridia bacterium]|nr:hypothetical protein [Clostridia bacterium]
MKRVLVLLLCLVMMIASLASCEMLENIIGGKEEECTHTYSDKWSTDATNHWYAATCGCENEVANLAAHADANKDGKCDVCEYVMCAHTYAEVLSKDETGHWYAATCGCNVKKDFAAHVDEAKDGVCDTCEYVVCAHTYAEVLSKDETGHWYAATCGCNVKKDLAVHVDADSDGDCDVCDWVAGEGHTHTYPETYTYDDNNHWLVADCGCSIVSAVAAHVDENNDGECDVCDYKKCNHTYAEVLSKDETGHWYAATCGCNVVGSFVSHENADGNNDGLCDTCEYLVGMATVVDGLDSAASENINNVTVNQDKIQQGVNDVGQDYKLEWLFENFVKIYADYVAVKNGEYEATYYYSYYTNNAGQSSVFVVRVDDYGNVSRVEEASEYDGSIYSYGLLEYCAMASNSEDIVKALYALAISDKACALEQSYDNGVYSFSFIYLDDTATSNADKYIHEATVSFTVNAENSGIATLDIDSLSYKYNAEWIVDGVCTIPENAKFYVSDSYEVNQQFGEPMTDVNNPYAPSDYILDDFNLVVKSDDDVAYEDGDSITIKAGSDNAVKFYFNDAALNKIAFNTVTVTTAFANGDDIGYGNAYASYTESWDGSKYVSFTGYKPGAYALTVDVEGLTLTINVTVEWATPTEIQPSVEVEGSYTTTSSVNTYTGLQVNFKSYVASGCNPAFTAAITSGDASVVAFTNADGVYSFKALVAGTYVVTLTSEVDTSVTCELTITVEAPPAVSDILNGKYTIEDEWDPPHTLEFTPESEGATNGSVVAELYVATGYDYAAQKVSYNVYTETLNYAYDAASGAITLTHVSGDETGVQLVIENYVLYVIYNGWDYKMVAVEDSDDVVASFPAGATAITVTTTTTYEWVDEYTYAADKAGTYKFVLPWLELGMWIVGDDDPASDYNLYAIFGSDYYTNIVEVYLDAGEKFSFKIYANTLDDWDITVEYSADSEGGESGGDGENESTITGDGSKETPYVVTGAGNVLIYPSYYTAIFVQVSAGVTVSLDGAAQFVTDADGALGTTVTPTVDTTYMIYADSMAGCTCMLTATVGTSGGNEDNTEGTEDAPYELDSIDTTVTANCDATNKTFYTFTATASGTLTITYPTANSWITISDLTDASLNTQSSQLAENTFAIVVGHEYTIGLGVWDAEAADPSVTLSFTASEAGGEEEEEITTSGYLWDDENTVTVSDDDISAGKVYYAFVPGNSGEYNIWSGNIYVSAVLDAEGNALTTNENNYYVLDANTNYIVELTLAGWVSGAGEYIVNAEYQYPLGHQENPNYFDWDYEFGTPVTAAYPGGYQPVWYAFYASADGVLTVTSDNEKATLMITAVFGCEAQGYNSVSLKVMAGRWYYIGVADFDTFDENYVNLGSDITFTPSFAEAAYVGNGTENEPNIMGVGVNTANVPQWTPVWFAYKADANGTLTVTTENELCVWYFKGQEDYATAGSKSIHIESGSIIYLYVATSDESAADIAFNASFKADPTEASYDGTLVTDGSAANEVVLEDNTYITFNVNGNGAFTVTWDNADAIVEVGSLDSDWNTVWTGIENGDNVTGVMYMGLVIKVYLPDYAAGTVSITIAPYVAPAQGVVVGDNTIAANGNSATNIAFTAPEANTYAFTVGDNAVVIYDYTNYFAGDVIKITLEADASVTLEVYTYDGSEADVNVNVAVYVVATADGEYRYVDPDDWKHRWVLVLGEDGTGTLKEQNYDSATFTWSASTSDTFTYTFEANSANGFDITFDFETGTIIADGTYSTGTVTDNNGSDASGIANVSLNGTNVGFFLYE